MPWKTESEKEQRWELVREIIRKREGVSELSRRLGISRKTAYKWKARFEERGRRGLEDLPPVARRIEGRLSRCWQERLRRWHGQYPYWGPRKIQWLLARRWGDDQAPSESTIKRWFKRWGWSCSRRRRPRTVQVARRPTLTEPEAPNDVWTVDFKGWFRTGSGTRVYPLTVRDMYSRYLFPIRLLKGQEVDETQVAMRGLFRTYGLPRCLRCDNGGPFGSIGCAGLTRLSAWWLKLGIRVEFMDPGRPDQNAEHEQMHSVLKYETAYPPSQTVRAQERRMEVWRREYNEVRPHEGLGMVRPRKVYRANRRRLPVRIRPWRYPKGWVKRWVKANGELRLEGRRWFVGEAFGKDWVGLETVSWRMRRVYFGKLLVGELHVGDELSIRPVIYRQKNKIYTLRPA